VPGADAAVRRRGSAVRIAPPCTFAAMPSRRCCARPDCSGDAVASLGYDYRARTVWLDACLDPDPSRHDLCQGHADRLRVPTGWRLHDRRGAVPDSLAMPAPAAH
jgi:hypothetical protein